MIPPFICSAHTVLSDKVNSLYHSLPSPHHPMLAEVVTATLVTVQAAIAAFLLAYTPASRIELMEWTLLPIVGASIAAGGAFCLNTQQEVRRIVVGRCLFALFVGVIGPRFVSMFHPWISEVMADPLMKVGAGFCGGFLGYVVSWWFVKRMYERAAPIAAQLVRQVEDNLVDRVSTKVASDAAQVAVGVARELSKHDPTDHTAVHVAEAIAQVAVNKSLENPPTPNTNP